MFEGKNFDGLSFNLVCDLLFILISEGNFIIQWVIKNKKKNRDFIKSDSLSGMKASFLIVFDALIVAEVIETCKSKIFKNHDFLLVTMVTVTFRILKYFRIL